MPEILNNLVATLIVPLLLLAGQLWLNSNFKTYEAKREAERIEKDTRHAHEEEWRESITQHMKDQDKKIDMLMLAQASAMRSDIIHKAHRYQEQGWASVEEKEALSAEHGDYKKFCEETGIVNNFIEQLVAQTIDLPVSKEEK